MTALSIEEFRDLGALDTISGEWWALWRSDPVATPFQTPPWVRAWWSAFAPGELMVLAVRKGRRLVGLAPLYVETRAGDKRLLPIGISLSDYQDVLIDPEAAKEIGEVLAGRLSAGAPWHRCEFPDALTESNIVRFVMPQGSRGALEPSSPCPVLNLPSQAADLETVIPARKRRDLRMARNRIARNGNWSISVADREMAREALTDLFRLHGARWNDRGEPGVLADPRVIQFHAEALPGLMAEGLARLYCLKIGDRAVGVYYGFMHRARAYGYLTGFDPVHEFVSPGTLLIAHAIEEAVREGAREFHFLRGRETYKFQWGAAERWNRRAVLSRIVADVYVS
jgi:CelD/BcsL family acetyltransferase involved in cellulose biosynthesis